MRLLPLAFAALLLAGCASPDPTPAGDGPKGPIPLLPNQLGLLAIDLTTRGVTALTDSNGYGWMSPSGAWVTWLETGFSVLLASQTGDREVVQTGQWTRIYDNGTGLELQPTGAVWKVLRTGEEVGAAPLPPPPIDGSRWNGASDDFTVFAAEYVPASPRSACENDIYVRTITGNARTSGCHLRVAADGRVGWTEGGGVRVRGRDGVVNNLTAPGGGDASSDSYVSYENPVFTSNGTAYLKLTGGRTLVRSEVIGPDGSTLVTVGGPTRLALLDISADGRFLLLRSFVRN